MRNIDMRTVRSPHRLSGYDIRSIDRHWGSTLVLASSFALAFVVIFLHGLHDIIEGIDGQALMNAMCPLVLCYFACTGIWETTQPERPLEQAPKTSFEWLHDRMSKNMSPLDMDVLDNERLRRDRRLAAALVFATDVAGQHGSTRILEALGERVERGEDINGFVDEWSAFYPDVRVRDGCRPVDIVVAWWQACLARGTAIPPHSISFVKTFDRDLWYAILSVQRRRGVHPQGLPLLLAASAIVETPERHAERRRQAEHVVAALSRSAT